jgi:hypothetical protein
MKHFALALALALTSALNLPAQLSITPTGAGGGTGTATAATSWYNVKAYGAVGDGSTDDNVAIAAAITAIPSTGGVLYFPPGTYKDSAGHTLSKPITVRGDGGTTGEITDNAISQINCTSATAVLFSVTSEGCSFQDISLKNTAGTTPTAGTAIRFSSTTGVGDLFRIDNVKVWRFFDNIDIQSGQQWSIDHSYIIEPVRYGVRVRDVNLQDGGDWSISNTTIIAYTATQASGSAGIRYESGSAGKITNVKINGATTNSKWFDNGIDIVPAFGNLFLLVSNCSIENFATHGISSTDGMLALQVNNCQFGDNVSPFKEAINLAYSSTAYQNVTITGNVFKAPSSTVYAAVALYHVTTGNVSGNVETNFPQLLYTENSTVTQSPQVQEVKLTGTAASISFTVKPGYANLDIACSGRGTAAATSTELLLSFNSDTTAANYVGQQMTSQGNSMTGVAISTTAGAKLGSISCASEASGIPGAVRASVPNYSGATFHKIVEATSLVTDSGNNYGLVNLTRWKNIAAVTTVTLTPATGSFAAGTVATLTAK